MKKLSLLAFGLILLCSPIFYSCENGSENEVVNPPELATAQSVSLRCYIKQICIPEIVLGTKLWLRREICYSGSSYQCELYSRKRCYPLGFECFWDPFDWIDPWDWERHMNPLDIYDFRNDLKDVIDPDKEFATFPINDDLLGLQYYNEIPGLIDKEVFNVHTSIELDEQSMESIGLKGNVIPAGKYPVAFNEKSGTFNAIVSVGEFPIVREKQIAVGKFDADSDLTEFLMKSDIELIEKADIIETKKGINPVGYTPNPDEPYPPFPWPFPWGPFPWITIFTPNELSVGIQIYNPQGKEFKLKEKVGLNEKLAEIIGVKSFLLTNENMEQQFDKEMGVTTILIHAPQR